MKMILTTLSVALLSGMLHGATVAEWDFDQNLSLAGTWLSDTPAADISGNGNTMLGYDHTYGATYSTLGETPSGVGLSLEAQGGQDGYVVNSNEGALRYWSPLTWTIEATVQLDVRDGWNTFVGKDGTSHAGQWGADFNLQTNGDTDEFRLRLSTVSGQLVIIDSGIVPELGRWYQLAAVSDGATVSLYVNDGSGYALAGSETLTGATDDDNRLSSGNDAAWTFLRGWLNGDYTYRVDGRIDNIRFSDVALSPGALLPMGNESHGTVIMISGCSLWFVLGFGWLLGKTLKRRSTQK